MLNRKSLLVEAVRTIKNMNSQSTVQAEALLSQGLNPPETPSGGGASMPLVPETLAQRFDPSEASSGDVVSQPLVSVEALEFQGLNPPETPLVVVDQSGGGVSEEPAVPDPFPDSLCPNVPSLHGARVLIAEPGSVPDGEFSEEECGVRPSFREAHTVTILSLECEPDRECHSYITRSVLADNPSVIVDTAATRHVIGRDTLPYAVNVRPLPCPITLCTANDTVVIREQGDLPGAGVPMQGALVVRQCSKSLCAVVVACREENMSLIVDDGASSARFTRRGKLVKSLDCEGDLISFVLKPDDGHGCAAENACLGVPELDMQVRESDLLVHAMVLDAISDHGSKGLVCLECTCMLSMSESVLAEHYLDGHRPAMGKCPWCKQAGMRHRTSGY